MTANMIKYFPILIHGDASIAGQGIVYEVLQMSNSKVIIPVAPFIL